MTRVGDVMSTSLVVADLNEESTACLGRMQQTHVRHLLVLDHGRLAGILSLRDVLALQLDDKNEEVTLLNAYVHHIPVDLNAGR